MELSQTEENYLKAIFKIAEKQDPPVSTNAIADLLETSASSVTDMLQRLSEKKLMEYKKYRGVTLTNKGEELAKRLIRKHRLWEYFLEEKLGFRWDEVHEIAEQLEHIKSDVLTERLDSFLGHPRYDPHGDPIPDEHGNIYYKSEVLLSDLDVGDSGVIVGVKEHSPEFLQYLDRVRLVLGTDLEVINHFDYDNSLEIKVDGEQPQTVSHQVSKNIYVKPVMEGG